jgi:hypothetical protein
MKEEWFVHPNRFPQNVDGPFYTTGGRSTVSTTPEGEPVWGGDCLKCGLPEVEAPTLLAPFDDTFTDTYFVRQPSTPEEVEQAINAIRVCCVEALRYSGRDVDIISRLDNHPGYCDYIVTVSGSLVLTIGEDGEFRPFVKVLRYAPCAEFWLRNQKLGRPQRTRRRN